MREIATGNTYSILKLIAETEELVAHARPAAASTHGIHEISYRCAYSHAE
jgi:hypothetical protein